MFNRKEILMLSLMTLVHFCLIVDFMVIMPMGPQLMRLFEIDPLKFGSLVSSYTLSAGITGILVAFFMDNYDRKKLLLIFFCGFALSNLSCAFVNSYETLILARSVIGVFSGALGSIIFSIVSDLIIAEKRGTATGILMTAHALAAIVGIPISLYLANHFSWHSPFIFIFIVSALLFVLIAVYLQKVDAHLAEQRLSLKESVQQFKNLIFESRGGIGLLFMATLILGHFSVNPFLFPSIVINAQITEARLPVVYLIVGLGSIIASILFGKLSDKYGIKKVFALALLFSLVPIVFVTNFGPSSIVWVTFATTLFFVLMGGRMTPAIAMITRSVSSTRRGSFLSLVTSFQQLSAALASFASGMIVKKTADGTLTNFNKVGFFAIGFSLLALYLSQKIEMVEGDG